MNKLNSKLAALKKSALSATGILFMTISAMAESMPMKVKEVETSSNDGIQFGIIAIILSLASVGLAVYLLFQHNKSIKDISKIKNQVKKLGKLNDESVQSDSVAEIAKIKKQIVKLSDRIDEIETPVNGNKSSQDYAQPSISGNRSTSENQSAAPIHKSMKVFVGIPNGRTFTTATKEYIPGKSLYLIDSPDGVMGSISFVNKKDSIYIARRDLSIFVESVCIVQEKKINNINGIRTIKPGKVSAIGSEWRLDQKAIVEYI